MTILMTRSCPLSLGSDAMIEMLRWTQSSPSGGIMPSTELFGQFPFQLCERRGLLRNQEDTEKCPGKLSRAKKCLGEVSLIKKLKFHKSLVGPCQKIG